MSPARQIDVVPFGKKLRLYRRLLAAMASTCLALTAAVALSVVDSPAAVAAPSSSATMNFNGALNLLGVLNSLTVSPSQVSISAGGQVRFVNKSGITMTLSVAGQSVSLPGGGSRTFGFPGRNSAQTFTASVTPLNVPVLGSITQSSGTVNVAPQSAPSQSPSASTGSPSQRPSATTGPKSAPSPDKPSTAAANQAQANDKTKWQFGEAPVLLDGNTSTGEGPAGQSSKPTTTKDHARNAAESEGLGEGWVGLLIAVAAVFLVGVGSAAIRAMVVQRRSAAG